MRKPEILVFAGPNGSGKSTITEGVEIVGEYVNADEIKKQLGCTDIEAAQIATARREELLLKRENFTFETVLSARRNLELLQRARESGYFIKCFYVLTENPKINIQRVAIRVGDGGHDVPTDKIVSRYHKCMTLIPELVDVCDVIHIYDNTEFPFRIFKKKKEETYIWTSDVWERQQIEELVSSKYISHH